MDKVIVNPEKFAFQYLPDYAAFILRHKLQEYVLHSIRFSRDEELPLLKSLSRFSDDELMAISMESSRETLKAIVSGTISELIRQNVLKWLSNRLELIDKEDVAADDLALVAFIKRKTLSCFLPEYTEDRDLKRHLMSEIDVYTTQEELVGYNAYIRMQQQKLNKINADLQFNEDLLLEAQEISELGSFYIDYINGENSIITPQISKITGLPSGFGTEVFFQQVHPDDVPTAKAAWEKASKEGGPFDYIFRYFVDGTEKRLHSSAIIKVENGIPMNVRGTLKDITKEYQLIKKLTESEELHKQAQQLTHLGNWSWEIGTDIIEWSDEMYRIYGLEPQSEKITFARFISLIHPDDREKRQTEIDEAIKTGVVKDYTLKIVNPGGKIKILKGHGSIITDKTKTPVKIVGTCQDITREYYLNQELIALNNSLLEKNNELVNINRELESFNYIASHDLQEPLRKIQIYSGRLLELAGTLSDDAKQSIHKVVSSASRMQRLIADLIEFSQISSPSEAFENISLDAIFEDVKNTYSHIIEEENALLHVTPMPVLRVIPFQFMQLFTNIIGNAFKYKRDGVAPQVTVSWKISTDPESEANTRYVRISICDNGIGFDSEQRDNIFDLFKRLHANEKYSGTGIGLALCKKIVSNHDGFIKAESEKDKGSCFHIYLPENRLVSQT